MGNLRTSGRFNTRAELVERVRFLYYDTSLRMSSVARNCGVSFGCANAIIDSREWEVLGAEDFQFTEHSTNKPEEGAFTVEHERIDDQSCGHGYMPEPCTVHLPLRVLRDLGIA